MVIKTLFVVLLVGSISAVHLLHTGDDLGFHVLHQQLFYIPLVLASFWFGIRAGLSTAVAVSILYGPAMLLRHNEAGVHLTVITQIALYLFVAFLMGWLSDRQRRQQQELLKSERITALGKAASTLGVEIRDIVTGVDSIYRQSGGLKNVDANDDFIAEIDRLKTMVEGLSHFAPSLDHLSFSTDLNDVLRQSFEKFRPLAAGKGLNLSIEPIGTGCPTTISVEPIFRIFDELVGNAIDFSPRGQTVVLRSFSGENHWVLEVADSGPGVTKENEEKLFTAFFTTRPDGYGLSLSSGRKLLRDLGGDLVYQPGDNEGAIFRMLIPKTTGKNLLS